MYLYKKYPKFFILKIAFKLKIIITDSKRLNSIGSLLGIASRQINQTIQSEKLMYI